MLLNYKYLDTSSVKFNDSDFQIVPSESPIRTLGSKIVHPSKEFEEWTFKLNELLLSTTLTYLYSSRSLSRDEMSFAVELLYVNEMLFAVADRRWVRNLSFLH